MSSPDSDLPIGTGIATGGLFDPGTLEYNGVEFNLYSCKISGHPVLDDAGRTVKYVEWTIEVEAKVFSNILGLTSFVRSPTDTKITTLRRQLTEIGKEFHLESKGFGILWVNGGSSGSVPDVNWGPIPKVITWVPVGNDKAAHITWQCTVHVPECVTPRHQGIMSFVWETGFDIDIHGWTTLNHKGTIEIANNRNSNGDVLDNVDRYRSFAKREVLPGFQRIQQNYSPSKNHSRLDFHMVDKEIPVPLPNDVTIANIRHRISSGLNKGFAIWGGSIGGSIVMKAGETKEQSWDRFNLILRDRLGLTKSKLKNLDMVKKKSGGKKEGTLMLTSVEIDEEVFGISSEFNVGYSIVGANLSNILEVSGLWKPIEGTSFNSWKRSLLDSAFHERGFARITIEPENDKIIDLCKPVPEELGGVGLDRNTRGAKKPSGAGKISEFAHGDSLIEEASSWLFYACDIVLDEKGNVVRHIPTGFLAGALKFVLNAIAIAVPQAGVTLGLAKIVGGQLPGILNPTGEPKEKFQRKSRPQYTIKLVGKGVRIGHRVPVPRLDNIDGEPCIHLDQVSKERTVGMIGGEKVFQTEWVVTYGINRISKELPVAENPMLEGQSTGGGGDF